MKTTPADLASIAAVIAPTHSPAAALLFSALVGSRADGTARPDSDWDIALKWAPQEDMFMQLGQVEALRHQIAHALATTPDKIDLIDLDSANLAMRANVANQGIALTHGESLAWFHFLQRTWRELEDFYWDRRHAA